MTIPLMPIISELVFYPVKSCAGISVQTATLTRYGLAVNDVYDREWMVVTEDGQFLTQREFPKLALVTPRLKADVLELRAPNMLRLELPLGLPHPDDEVTREVHLWDDTVLAYDCGDLAATWFSNAIGSPCRLVRYHPRAGRLTSGKWTGGEQWPTMFADGYPVLVIGSASLADLNGRLLAAGRGALPMNRFRPNLVVDGMPAYEEDYVATFDLGENAQLRPCKPCARCPIPAVDQQTGERGPDPLDVLNTYRANPKLEGAAGFGMNAVLEGAEEITVHVGQDLPAQLNF
nr:MOSC N-terminal beta barrel domain protein [uncultured bacterium]AIA18078.1 MOSC N-terminal beta barrel domain protein [uncultured bacterium]